MWRASRHKVPSFGGNLGFFGTPGSGILVPGNSFFSDPSAWCLHGLTAAGSWKKQGRSPLLKGVGTKGKGAVHMDAHEAPLYLILNSGSYLGQEARASI